MPRKCVECKLNPANHWSGNLCEECYKQMLHEKLDEDEFEQHALAHPSIYYRN
jgi:hypothetical protein